MTAILFGTLPIILKILLRKLDPFTLSWYRYAIAVGFLGLLSFRQYDLLAPYRMRGRRLFLLIVATIGLCANFVLYTLGLDYSTPNTAQILIQLAPMLLLVGGLLIFKESFSIRQGLGLGILTLGLILFFDGKYDEILTGASTLWLGILWTAISAALWACYGLAQKQLLRHLSGRAIMFTIYCAGTLIYLIWAQPLQALTLTIFEWILLAASSIMTVIGYVSLAAAINNNKNGLIIEALAELDPVTQLPTGQVLLDDQPGTIIDVSAAPTLQVTGVPGGAQPVRIDPSFSSSDVKLSLLNAINSVNDPGEPAATTLSAVDRGGNTLFSHYQSSACVVYWVVAKTTEVVKLRIEGANSFDDVFGLGQ